MTAIVGSSKRVCDVCGKTFTQPDPKGMTYEMPSIFPDLAPAQHACSPRCYKEWAGARQQEDRSSPT